jgi:hypothetical protein
MQVCLAGFADFVSRRQARYNFELAFIDVLAFRQEMDVNPPTTEPQRRAMREQHVKHQHQTQDMSDRLDDFLGQLSHITSQEDREAILGIKLFREQVRVYMKVLRGFDGHKHARDIDWHIDEQDMGSILDLASELLKAPRDLEFPAGALEDYYQYTSDVGNASRVELPACSRPVFSSCSGLLSALWLVAS